MQVNFIQNLSYNKASSILYNLGYKNPLKTIIKKNRTKLFFLEDEAIYNEMTGTLKIVKY